MQFSSYQHRFFREAVELSKQKVAPSTKITFEIVDLTKPLPFADQSFDAVYFHLALHYFDNQKTIEVFNEIHRVLKTGGVFAAFFNTINDPEVKQNLKIALQNSEVKELVKTAIENKSINDEFVYKVSELVGFDKYLFAIKPYLELKGVQIGN